MNRPVSQEMRDFNRLLGELEGVCHEASLRLGLSDSSMKEPYHLCSEGAWNL